MMMKSGGAGRYTNYRRPILGKARDRRWPRLAVAILAPLLLAGLLGLVYRGLTRSSFFQVTDIDIEGVKRLSKEQVLELSGVDIHSNLLALSGRLIRERLLGNGWVAKAEVTRRWPDRLEIRIGERLPAAILNRDGQLFYLDRHGLAFAPVLPSDDLDFPVISGAGKGGSADRAEPDGLGEALQFIRYAGSGNPNLPAQNISEINIADPGELVLYLTSRPFPIRLGQGAMKDKYDRLTRVLSGLYKRREFGEIAYIDADYRDGQVLVGLAGGQES